MTKPKISKFSSHSANTGGSSITNPRKPGSDGSINSVKDEVSRVNSYTTRGHFLEDQIGKLCKICRESDKKSREFDYRIILNDSTLCGVSDKMDKKDCNYLNVGLATSFSCLEEKNQFMLPASKNKKSAIGYQCNKTPIKNTGGKRK
ncbi:MAG: hypothetical protein KKG60_03485 [Nanoarchaeota archaeon]|nr:hypothetical protein [Nanoarchaeota archaeon]